MSVDINTEINLKINQEELIEIVDSVCDYLKNSWISKRQKVNDAYDQMETFLECYPFLSEIGISVLIKTTVFDLAENGPDTESEKMVDMLYDFDLIDYIKNPFRVMGVVLRYFNEKVNDCCSFLDNK